jgi:hypothetical protein
LGVGEYSMKIKDEDIKRMFWCNRKGKRKGHVYLSSRAGEAVVPEEFDCNYPCVKTNGIVECEGKECWMYKDLNKVANK